MTVGFCYILIKFGSHALNVIRKEKMTKIERDRGKSGEVLAARVLASRGVYLLEEIASPVKLVPIPGIKRNNAFYVYWSAKVSGDHMGITECGRRVLTEVKTVLDRNLRWSDLRPHQPTRLRTNKDYNGISLLVWVHSTGVYVLDWIYPNDDFGPRKSISPEYAAELDVSNVNSLVKKDG